MSLDSDSNGFHQYEDPDRAENFTKYRQSTNVRLEKTLILEPSVRNLLNYDLSGQRVLNMACGAGESSTLLADLDPDEVVGADISSSMINMAIKGCSLHPKYCHIKFVLRDCSKPLDLGRFDLVFSKHFLNYAQNHYVLLGILTFISINSN